MVRGDTTVLEEFSRTPRVLEGEVRPVVEGARFGWARYRVELGPGGEPERADLSLGRVGTSPDSPAAEVWSVVLRDGTLRETRPDRPAILGRVPAGTAPVFAPSMAMNQEVVRQALLRSGRRGPVEIPIYPVATNGEVRVVTVSWPSPDTALVAQPGAPGSRFRVDEQGRILGGETPGGECGTVRLR